MESVESIVSESVPRTVSVHLWCRDQDQGNSGDDNDTGICDVAGTLKRLRHDRRRGTFRGDGTLRKKH